MSYHITGLSVAIQEVNVVTIYVCQKQYEANLFLFLIIQFNSIMSHFEYQAQDWVLE